jgi:triacylglycerol esterase/lipase EstA (alpha/beta hydrolase family)
MDRDYLQEALAKFNTDKAQWYGFRKTDDNGDTIPNDQRMKYEHLILNDDTATMPSESDVNAKIQEIKDAEQTSINKKASGKQKLKDLGLDDDEIQALIGV